MRCHVRITTGLRETYCYEPLDEQGKCHIHGQQVFLKPDWMGLDQWKKWLDKTQPNMVKVPLPPSPSPQGD